MSKDSSTPAASVALLTVVAALTLTHSVSDTEPGGGTIIGALIGALDWAQARLAEAPGQLKELPGSVVWGLAGLVAWRVARWFGPSFVNWTYSASVKGIRWVAPRVVEAALWAAATVMLAASYHLGVLSAPFSLLVAGLAGWCALRGARRMYEIGAGPEACAVVEWPHRPQRRIQWPSRYDAGSPQQGNGPTDGAGPCWSDPAS